jgi:hypothetical protein
MNAVCPHCGSPCDDWDGPCHDGRYYCIDCATENRCGCCPLLIRIWSNICDLVTWKRRMR